MSLINLGIRANNGLNIAWGLHSHFKKNDMKTNIGFNQQIIKPRFVTKTKLHFKLHGIHKGVF